MRVGSDQNPPNAIVGADKTAKLTVEIGTEIAISGEASPNTTNRILIGRKERSRQPRPAQNAAASNPNGMM